MTLAAMRSVFETSLRRYSRSKGLWLLLLTGLLGARFWIPREDGTTVLIAINRHLPAMTSAMLGTSLGIVVSTLLLPLGFIYLRSNTTRQRPWQVEEVTSASRVAMSLGSFFADSVMFGAVLTVITIAGWILAWLTLPVGQVHLGQIAVSLWLLGAPALMGLAAIRLFLDSLAITRNAAGDVIFFGLWFATLAVPLFNVKRAPGFATKLLDFGGFAEPLMHFARGRQDIQIGFGASLLPGRISIDVMTVLLSKPYMEARLFWAAAAVLIAIAAGFVYQPHNGTRRTAKPSVMSRWFVRAQPPKAQLPVAPSQKAVHPFFCLVGAEFLLIFTDPLILITNASIALAGIFGNYRHVVSPAILVVLIFGLTSHAARSETRGILSLTSTMPIAPALRRIAFCFAGLAWTLLLSLPSLLVHRSLQNISTAVLIGLTAPLLIMALSYICRSAFAPRLMLLIGWFVYLSA